MREPVSIFRSYVKLPGIWYYHGGFWRRNCCGTVRFGLKIHWLIIRIPCKLPFVGYTFTLGSDTPILYIYIYIDWSSNNTIRPILVSCVGREKKDSWDFGHFQSLWICHSVRKEGLVPSWVWKQNSPKIDGLSSCLTYLGYPIFRSYSG